ERRIDVGIRRRVPERDRDIAQPALVARAADRAALGAPRPFVLGPAEELDELRGVEAVARREIGQRGAPRELVPRAEELTVVAAEDPVADERAQRLGDRAAQLDRQIRDAAPGVELVGRDDRAGRTDVETRGARAAMRADR